MSHNPGQFVQWSRMISGDEGEAPPASPCERVDVEMLTEQQIISEVIRMPQTHRRPAFQF